MLLMPHRILPEKGGACREVNLSGKARRPGGGCDCRASHHGHSQMWKNYLQRILHNIFIKMVTTLWKFLHIQEFYNSGKNLLNFQYTNNNV